MGGNRQGGHECEMPHFASGRTFHPEGTSMFPALAGRIYKSEQSDGIRTRQLTDRTHRHLLQTAGETRSSRIPRRIVSRYELLRCLGECKPEADVWRRRRQKAEPSVLQCRLMSGVDADSGREADSWYATECIYNIVVQARSFADSQRRVHT